MYSLFERVNDGLSELALAFGKYVKMAGAELVNNPAADQEKDKNLVQCLLGNILAYLAFVNMVTLCYSIKVIVHISP